jgi:arylsulfatase A-like enzyme
MPDQNAQGDQSSNDLSRRDAVKTLGGLSLGGLLGSTGGCASASDARSASKRQRPNIVLVVADDLGYGDLGSYGQTRIRTPRLDRMAREGMSFRQFYAGSTVCAPSRSVLMTGRHTGHTPVRGNARSESGPIGNAPLPVESETIAEMLQRAGYATGAFGKWGLGGPGSTGMPTEQGFDEFFGYLDQLRAHYYYPEFLYRGGGERVPLDGNEVADNPPVAGAGKPRRRGTYSQEAIMKKALSFVERHREEPFFLYLPSTIPHVSLAAPEEAMARYQDDAGDSIFPEEPFEGGHYTGYDMPRAAYAAMVSRLDRDVGRVIDRIQSLGLSGDTIVLFTSDNGPSRAGGSDPAFFDSNGPLRGGKKDLYEGGIRIPLIAWAPGRVPSGATNYHTAYFGDVMATLADVADAEPPTPNDSLSFLPALLDQENQEEHEHLYWEYYNRGTMQAVRRDRWKAIRQPMATGEAELYDLQRDLSERQNVAEAHPEVVRQMEDVMRKSHTPSSRWKTPAE